MKQFLTITGLLCLFTANIFAYDFVVDGIYYSKSSDSTVSVSNNGSTNSYSGVITIPETISNNDTLYTVTAIGGSAFRECSNLDSVNISTSIKTIGSYAFYQSSIKGFDMTDSITTIGDRAFTSCEEMTSIYISENVTELPDFVFSNTALDSVIIPNSVTLLGTGFIENSAIRYIKLSESITAIPWDAFEFCMQLESITIPPSVTFIGTNAFLECESLNGIVIPSTVTSFGSVIFSQCYSFTNNVILPDNLTEIPQGMFGYCINMDSLVIPASVTNIGAYAFNSCTGIKKLQCNAIIPPTVADDSFEYCGTLSEKILYVPLESVSLYEAADIWTEFNIVGIEIKQTVVNNITEEACDNTIFAGETITQSGIYYDTIAVSSLKDSVIILSLTINNSYYIEITDTIYNEEEYIFNSQPITTGGVYAATYRSAQGCDSTVAITIHQIITEEIYDTICYEDTYEFNGKTFSSATGYSKSLTETATFSVNTYKDSIVTLHLYIREQAWVETNPSFTIPYGAYYSIDDTSFRAPENIGFYYFALPDVTTGCIIHTALGLVEASKKTIINEIIETAFDEYEFGGRTITQSGIYYDTIELSRTFDTTLIIDEKIQVYREQTFTEFIDSVVVLDLTIKKNAKPEITTSTTHFEIPVNSENGTLVTTIQASDIDADPLSFFLTYASDAYAINSTTGEIYVNNNDFLISDETLSLTVNVSDGIDTSSLTITIKAYEESTGINEDKLEVSIYPTLVQDILYIDTDAASAKLIVRDIQGCIVLRQTISESTKIDCGNFTSGTYFIIVDTGKKLITKKIIIQ